jgi:hypothetical protein
VRLALLGLALTGCATLPPLRPDHPFGPVLERVLVDIVCWPALTPAAPRLGPWGAERGPEDRCA